MIYVTEKNVSSDGSGQYYTEASTLRWTPGEIATRLQTNLGNGLPFIAEKIIRGEDEELLFVKFRQIAGCISLTVFND